MARRKLPKHPTAASLRVGHTVYAVLFDCGFPSGAFQVKGYRLTSGPDCRREGEVLPALVPLVAMRAGLLACERLGVASRVFWTRRQAQRCAEKSLRDYRRGGR